MIEQSVLRSENKFLVSPIQVASLKERLGIILTRDEHVNSHDNSYLVRSLYFDSINNTDFNQKLAGTEIRKKIRLRVYSPYDSTVKLEMKQKFGDLQEKISITITKEEAIALCNGDYSVLIPYLDQSDNAVKIYTTMVLGVYRPAVMVEYDRIAFTHPLYSTRLTLDMNVRSSESNFDLFDPNISYVPLMDYETVLEVKYNEKLLRFISTTLKPYHLTKVAVSKYLMARKVFYDFNY